MAEGKVHFKLIQSESKEKFDRACEKAIEDNYIFTGQVIMSGLGGGKFLYTQQWIKKEGEDASEQLAPTT